MKSKPLAVALLFIIAGMHYLADPLAKSYAHPATAVKALEFILGGVGGTALLAVIGLLARNPVVWACCIWGMAEQSEKAICRMARPIDTPPQVELFSGLCGYEFYWVGLIAALALALTLLDGQRNAK